MQYPVDSLPYLFTYGNDYIITRVLRESNRGNRFASALLLRCTKKSLKIDCGYKNTVNTRKVALRDKIEKIIRTWKAKRVCSRASKYKYKRDMKAIEEAPKELEQKRKSCITSTNCN